MWKGEGRRRNSTRALQMVEGTECQGPKAGMSFCLSQEEKEWGGQVDDGGNRFREMTGAHSQASEAHTAWLDSQLTKDTQSQTPVPCSTFPRREDRQCTFLPLPSFLLFLSYLLSCPLAWITGAPPYLAPPPLPPVCFCLQPPPSLLPPCSLLLLTTVYSMTPAAASALSP